MQGFSIGKIRLENQFVLAPMFKATDLPFRLLCREQGAGLVFTEMVNSEAIRRGNKSMLHLTKTCAEEKPVGLQVFGAKPEVCAEAARLLESHFDIIDFNLGCPVREIRRQGAGSALLIRPKRVAEIISAISKAVEKPVTAKIRLLPALQDTIALAKIIEKNGAAALTVHGRTVKQMYSGEVDLQAIKAIKGALSIPVLGNGGIESKADAERMLAETSCDAVMIGQAALGNPGIFAELTGKAPLAPKEAFLRYLELAENHDCHHPGRIKLQSIQFAKRLKSQELIQRLERAKETVELKKAFVEF